ncbi:GNAT family N-acetyltransferase [Sphingobacterium faecium]|uniref:GNAT family N-acetyltransferase n=1 Tax=Sphingobacterium faecium TaxID=34087 RepID=UPI0024794978|nr:GNAT family N-acetyltransferase [Sphingobacterium faecium]WGQ13785.1 GNAT family N-acetyltransferase [Sphingobacterium faecium]
MFQIIEYSTVQDFYQANRESIYKNRLSHYHLIKYFSELNKGNQSIYESYNILDKDGGNVICVWADSVYYLYALKWSESIVQGLLTKIKLEKYTKRFSFCGTLELIKELFERSGIDYEVFKERNLFECFDVKLLEKAPIGRAYFSSNNDLDKIAKMTYDFGLEEWGKREGRDLQHALGISLQAISAQTSINWQVEDKIVSLATILDSDTEISIIGNLYTLPEERGNGYAKSLVYEITKQIVQNGDRCGIVSDADNAITNKMFREIGYEEVSRYISVRTLREKV